MLALDCHRDDNDVSIWQKNTGEEGNQYLCFWPCSAVDCSFSVCVLDLILSKRTLNPVVNARDVDICDDGKAVER